MQSCEALSVILCDVYFFNDALFLRNLLTFETHVKQDLCSFGIEQHAVPPTLQ